MRVPVQEKIQVTATPEALQTDTWVDSKSARRANMPSDDGAKFNCMPPGMSIDNQKDADIHATPLVLAGTSDVSCDTNPESLARGFTHRAMGGTDDQYTDEHVDYFYGDVGGFVERNNYLDRE